MSAAAQSITVETRGRGTVDITARVQGALRELGATTGLCTVFVHHTSASVIICENADATVRSDLERWMERAVPDGDEMFEHTDEGRMTCRPTSLGSDGVVAVDSGRRWPLRPRHLAGDLFVGASARAASAEAHHFRRRKLMAASALLVADTRQVFRAFR